MRTLLILFCSVILSGWAQVEAAGDETFYVLGEFSSTKSIVGSQEAATTGGFGYLFEPGGLLACGYMCSPDYMRSMCSIFHDMDGCPPPPVAAVPFAGPPVYVMPPVYYPQPDYFPFPPPVTYAPAPPIIHITPPDITYAPPRTIVCTTMGWSTVCN